MRIHNEKARDMRVAYVGNLPTLVTERRLEAREIRSEEEGLPIRPDQGAGKTPSSMQ